MGFPEFLAWPDDTGVAGGFLVTAVMGVPAYIHTHLKLSRHHRERMSQAERHHAERAPAGVQVVPLSRKGPL